jgi:hypothetical protein
MCDAGDVAYVFYAQVLSPTVNRWAYTKKAAVDKKTGKLLYLLDY